MHHLICQGSVCGKEMFSIAHEPVKIECMVSRDKILGMIFTIKVKSRNVKIIEEGIHFQRGDGFKENGLIKHPWFGR